MNGTLGLLSRILVLLAAAVFTGRLPWRLGLSAFANPMNAASGGGPSPAAAPPQQGQPGAQLKPGLTPQEVEKLLGKPADSASFGENLIYTYAAVKVIFKSGKLVDAQPTPGQTPRAVEKLLGKPDDSTSLGENLIYTYPSKKVIFKDDKVVDVQQQQPVTPAPVNPAGQNQPQTQPAQVSQQKQSKKSKLGGFFGGLKAVSGQGSQQELATATAGSKSVGEGRKIADVTPSEADRQAVAQMESSTVSTDDLKKFREEGHLSPKQ